MQHGPTRATQPEAVVVVGQLGQAELSVSIIFSCIAISPDGPLPSTCPANSGSGKFDPSSAFLSCC